MIALSRTSTLSAPRSPSTSITAPCSFQTSSKAGECQISTPRSASLRPNDIARGGAIGTTSVGNAIKNTGSFFYSLIHSPYSKRKAFLRCLIALFAVCTILFAFLYTFHHGFRRTVQFWTGIGPLVIEYKFIKFKSKYIDRCDNVELQRRVKLFHLRTAPKAVHLIQSLGGIYVKIGQLMSTLGSGILDETYVKALRPLQDGVPPRDMEQISCIIEKSTGKKMDDIFVTFEEQPIGAASIAQAHRATLRTTNSTDTQNSGGEEEVIVKVQYPEVAELFDADLSNLELVTKLFMPENIELVQALRKRHENELDFTIEAANLRECARNMQSHGVEPLLVRIPRVVNETGICTQHVLVMEYLRGTSLADAIEQEQNRVANALGKKDAAELRSTLAKRMREHFERGGGAGSGGMEMLGGGGKVKLVQAVGPFAAKMLRAYIGVKERVGDFAVGLHNAGANAAKALSGGKVEPQLKSGSKNRQNRASTAHVNLARVLKTLVHVHGIQMLKDGVYNADPHPGNVLVLPDGRLGLLDYGMVGRLSTDERETVAQTVVALSRKDRKEAARLYRDTGYKATWKKGEITDANVLHRFATFHLDKIDLSPVTMETGEKTDIMLLLRSVQERAVPDWIEQARRLGGLLMGVAAQAARPISLAKEWESIAAQSLRQEEKKRSR